MATSGDVTFAQDGGYGNVKLHPYIVAMVRWCVSYLWSTATVVLHRLMTAPLTPIAAKPVKRPAGRDHLHPEPRVQCAVLHQPAVHNLDVIFVHGLYGSLGNTWRQGEWRSKYPIGPEKVHLRRPKATLTPCKCRQCESTNTENTILSFVNENTINDSRNRNNDNRNMFNDINNEFTNIDEKFYKNIKKILPNEDSFTTEKFYNNTLLDQVEIVDNYDSQAKFVSDLFKSSCDSICDSNEQTYSGNGNNDNRNVFNDNDSCKCDVVANEIDCKCRSNEKKCEVGCGCICDGCYSPCWPKDWIKVDYPEARVISINYTSDPHLWRPLWIKENKRLRLHERAEQMTQQLLDLGVGSKPVIWVGHSKGGLFIKQIYCEAYEAYLKTNPKGKLDQRTDEQNMTEYNKDNEMNNLKDLDNNNDNRNSDNDNRNRNNDDQNENNDSVDRNNDNINTRTIDLKDLNNDSDNESLQLQSSDNQEDQNALKRRAALWQQSAGFMFYSVPHRGSPLADIKTPVTARSVELLEISKDCALVLSLQERWLRAAAPSPPAVRSLVETRRTLMSVLWLRIVSADSADPGIGALCGVSVDHREICKPSSRHCLLYTELATLIRVAVQKWKQ